jgi:hypothetical protein
VIRKKVPSKRELKARREFVRLVEKLRSKEVSSKVIVVPTEKMQREDRNR